MPFQYTFRADDISTWDVDTRDLLENRDRELELYSTTIDNSFLNLNASNLTSGTVPSARMTGAYTGITGLGTLTSLTIDGPSSSSMFFGDWNQSNVWSGIMGTNGYLLTGNSASGLGIYLRSESDSHPVYIGSNNQNTLRVDDTSATVTGTMNATTFSGSGASLTSLPSSQLTGQTGMWTSANRPGPYRLYRRDNDSNFSVQTYWTGARWRLYGYNGDSVHADTHVGYADSAGSASTAGSSNATTFTGTYVRMSGNGAADLHHEQGLQSGVGGDGAGLALWASGVAPQFRVGASNNTVYLRNADDSIYVTLEGIINNVSSLHLKQDIETFPQILHSAGAAVNEDEILTGLNIVRQLRPVSYKWKEKEHLSQLPENPRRALALSRLNTIRKSKGLEPYDSDELHHDCSRDSCSGTADNPCQWTENWNIGNIGFISQEVGAIIPQAAILGKEGEFTGLDSLAMTALAVAAIKELDAKVTSLIERIEALENK